MGGQNNSIEKERRKLLFFFCFKCEIGFQVNNQKVGRGGA